MSVLTRQADNDCYTLHSGAAYNGHEQVVKPELGWLNVNPITAGHDGNTSLS